MSSFDKQFKDRIIVLRKIIKDGPARHRDIVADTVARTGSPNISMISLRWLRARGYIERISRGVYEVTKLGIRLADCAPTGGVQG